MKLTTRYVVLIAIIVISNFISCKKEFSCENCNRSLPTINRPPVAIAFLDSLNSLPPDSKFVTAKNSSDPDGVIVSYKWSKISGPAPYTIVTPLSFQTIISNLVQGTYWFELTVTDNDGLTAKDTVQVIVKALPVNAQLRADAGADQTITLPLDSTYLDGSGSSPNGFTSSSPTIFRWTTIAGPTQYVLNAPPIPASLAKTTVVANGLVPGVYLFTFTVTVIGVGSVTDTVKVTVLDDPQNRNTVTYHNLVWVEGDPYGLGRLTAFLESPLRPDRFDAAGVYRGMEIFLKLNPSSAWRIVPFGSNSPYSWYAAPYTVSITTNPTNPLLVGTQSDLRIRFQ